VPLSLREYVAEDKLCAPFRLSASRETRETAFVVISAQERERGRRAGAFLQPWILEIFHSNMAHHL
jgi:hypothetical protein